MGVKLQLVLGVVLAFSVCTANSTNSTTPQNVPLEIPDRHLNLIEKSPKTDTEQKNVNSNTQKNLTSVKLNKTEPYIDLPSPSDDDVKKGESISNNVLEREHFEQKKENAIKQDIGREDSSRSIDATIQKYISPDFHSKNNVFTLPFSSDTEKYIERAFSYKPTTEKLTDFANIELTTPKSDFFDSRFTKAVQSIEQKLEQIDIEDDEDEDHSQDLQVEKLVDSDETTPYSNLMNFQELKNVIRNNTIVDKNSTHKDMIIEQVKRVNFETSFNDTQVYDDDDDDDKDDADDKGKIEKADVTTSKNNFILTTGKSVTLTKPPIDKNNSYILSNKIETETFKAINIITTEVPATKQIKSDDENIKPSVGISTTTQEIKTKEQSVQENQVIPIETISFDTTTPGKIVTPTSSGENSSSIQGEPPDVETNVVSTVKGNKEKIENNDNDLTTSRNGEQNPATTDVDNLRTTAKASEDNGKGPAVESSTVTIDEKSRGETTIEEILIPTVSSEDRETDILTSTAKANEDPKETTPRGEIFTNKMETTTAHNEETTIALTTDSSSMKLTTESTIESKTEQHEGEFATTASEQSTTVRYETSTTSKQELVTGAREELTTVAKEELTTVAKDELTTVSKEEFTTAAKEDPATAAKGESTTVAKEESTTAANEDPTTAPKEEPTTVTKEESTTAAKEFTTVLKEESTTTTTTKDLENLDTTFEDNTSERGIVLTTTTEQEVLATSVTDGKTTETGFRTSKSLAFPNFEGTTDRIALNSIETTASPYIERTTFPAATEIGRRSTTVDATDRTTDGITETLSTPKIVEITNQPVSTTPRPTTANSLTTLETTESDVITTTPLPKDTESILTITEVSTEEILTTKAPIVTTGVPMVHQTLPGVEVTTVETIPHRTVPITPTTTTIGFVHIKTIDENHTTLVPEVLNPGFNYSTPISAKPIEDRKVVIETFDATTTEFEQEGTATSSPDSLGGDSGDDRKGTIAAIVISTVGAVCLVLLAGLLYIMRKRQKRFNYGERCRPVNLDDYSVDNVSVYNSVRRKGVLRISKRSYGNPAFDDPTAVTHPLNFPALAKFASNTDDIKAEFEEIPQIAARTSELPEGCETKNRYANVIPLPETRVFLKPIDGYPNSDYINANYVTGPKDVKGYYIATQAPMQNTVDDFWRMIWEQQSKVILMVTHFFENGVEKCVDYLPPSEVLDCHRLFGDFQITLKKREVKDKYVISSLQLKNMVSNSWREVTHFWYMGWPEKGVPSEANSLIAFLIEARSFMKSSTLDKNSAANGDMNNALHNEVNPVVVHCSPGTGRTGVVIACDIAIREFEQSRLVDIPKIVYRIRRDRASAVQTKEQYSFIYKVVSLYATKLTGGALESF